MLSNMFGLFGWVFCDVVICESFSVFGASLDELLCDFKWLLGGFEAFGWWSWFDWRSWRSFRFLLSVSIWLSAYSLLAALWPGWFGPSVWMTPLYIFYISWNRSGRNSATFWLWNGRQSFGKPCRFWLRGDGRFLQEWPLAMFTSWLSLGVGHPTLKTEAAGL